MTPVSWKYFGTETFLDLPFVEARLAICNKTYSVKVPVG
jgi:hypothetical protein